MKKVYYFAPLAALLVFIAVYSVHRGGQRQREADKIAAAKAALVAKNEAEQARRKADYAAAEEADKVRKAERKTREEREKIEKEERQLAIDARDKAYREQEKFSKQVERLKKELETEEAALAKYETARRQAESEKTFLVEYVAKSRANLKALEGVVARLNVQAPLAAAPATGAN